MNVLFYDEISYVDRIHKRAGERIKRLLDACLCRCFGIAWFVLVFLITFFWLYQTALRLQGSPTS